MLQRPLQLTEDQERASEGAGHLSRSRRPLPPRLGRYCLPPTPGPAPALLPLDSLAPY